MSSISSLKYYALAGAAAGAAIGAKAASLASIQGTLETKFELPQRNITNSSLECEKGISARSFSGTFNFTSAPPSSIKDISGLDISKCLVDFNGNVSQHWFSNDWCHQSLTFACQEFSPVVFTVAGAGIGALAGLVVAAAKRVISR